MVGSKREEQDALNALVQISEMEQERNYVSSSKFFDDLFLVFHNYKNAIVPDSIESTYTGLHLNEKYEENDFLQMIADFRSNKMIHAKYALQIIQDALKLFKTYSNIEQCNLGTSSLPAVVIVGDLHGSFKDLDHIILKYGIPGKNFRFVFNGDFVDRGPKQSEVLLTLLYAFLLYPNRVFLNRGNHEDTSCNLSNHFKPNFNADCNKKFNQYGGIVFKKSIELFTYLPIATIVSNKAGVKCFVVHGGVSDRVDLKTVSASDLKRYEFESVKVRPNDRGSEQFTDLLWSDPMTAQTKPHFKANGCFPSSRGAGYLFGEDISRNFCIKHGFSAIIRSHEVVSEGWRQDHPNCYTVFSSSNYCGGTNKAAVLILNQTETAIQTYTFRTEESDVSSNQKQKDFLLATFKSYLARKSDDLNEKFKSADSQNSGWIKTKDWAHLLSEYLKSKHIHLTENQLLVLKDHLLPCDDSSGLAKYSQMFEMSLKSSAREAYYLLDSIFSLIDTNHNGSVSYDEAGQVIEQMNSLLGTSYTNEFITSMDLNKDGVIDIKEFKHGFVKAFELNKDK